MNSKWKSDKLMDIEPLIREWRMGQRQKSKKKNLNIPGTMKTQHNKTSGTHQKQF